MQIGAYTPTRDDVVNVIHLLHSNGIVVSNSRAAYEELKQYQSNPHFCMLLSQVFSSIECPVADLELPVAWTQYRQLAGITLKNNIAAARHALGEEALSQAGKCAILSLRTPCDARIARASAQIVVKITSLTSFQWWVDCCVGNLSDILLNELLPAGDLLTLGALYTLQYLMEDLPKLVGTSSEAVITKVAGLSTDCNLSLTLRKAAFRMCFNIYEKSSLLDWNVDTLSPLQQGLVNASWAFMCTCTQLLEQSCSGDVAFMIQVVHSGQFLLDYFDYFDPMDDSVKARLYRYWVHNTVDIITSNGPDRCENTELIAAAIDLVTAVLVAHDCSGAEGCASFLAASIPPLLHLLIPALVQYAHLSQEEVDNIMTADDYRIRDSIGVCIEMAEGANDISEDNQLNEEEAAMTLRRSALKCVEALCAFESSTTFSLVMQQVQSLCSQDDWRAREAGIVLVGTAANGCAVELEGNLPYLIPELLNVVRRADENICVVSIAIWSLSRIMESVIIVSPASFSEIIAVIASRLQSTSKRVQSASVTALNRAFSLSETSGDLSVLAQHYPALLEFVCMCLRVYTTGNLSLLIDLVSHLLRNLSDKNVQDQLAAVLKNEHETRWAQFESSYASAYVCQAANVLVNKDIFSIDRGLIAYLALHPDPSWAVQCLQGWSGALQDMLAREVTDDPDLAVNLLAVCCGYITTTPTAALREWMQTVAGTFTEAVFKCVTHFSHRQVKLVAVTLFSALVRSLGCTSLPGRMSDSLLLEAARTLADADEPQYKAELVRLISLLTRRDSSQLSDDALSYIRIANASLRSDVFGDSLFYFVQMTYDLCQLLETIPHAISHFSVDVIAQLMSQIGNSHEKAEATVRLCKAICQNSVEIVARFLPDVMRLVYSWQQAATEFPGTHDALRTMLHHFQSHCSAELHALINSLPPTFRQTIMTLYFE